MHLIALMLMLSPMLVMHGFVFWSIGAFTAVALSNLNIPYWANLLITGLVCYAVILTVTVIITPLIEFATKGATKNILRWASEEPVPHRKTTAPFTTDLILGRQDDDSTQVGDSTFTSRRESRMADSTFTSRRESRLA